jgi:hypothetical protein
VGSLGRDRGRVWLGGKYLAEEFLIGLGFVRVKRGNGKWKVESGKWKWEVGTGNWDWKLVWRERNKWDMKLELRNSLWY